MNYEVILTTNGHTEIHDVYDWRVKGAVLVPVYANDDTPQDESPFTEIVLRPKKTVAALLLTPNGLVLGKRASTSRVSPGLWEIPGGKPEHGEDDETALRRELREELGVEADIGAQFGEFEVSNGYVAVVYFAFTEDVPEAIEGHDEIRICTPDDLPEPEDFAPGNAIILAYLLAASEEANTKETAQ